MKASLFVRFFKSNCLSLLIPTRLGDVCHAEAALRRAPCGRRTCSKSLLSIKQEGTMRGSLVVLALAISPFVASVSKAQNPASTSTKSRPMCTKDPGNPSPTGEANRTKKCPPVATGKVTISGIVFFDLEPYDAMYDPENEIGLAGWTVV